MKAPLVLSVVDTREYEERGDKMVPIPGSGDMRDCDRCGRTHEVHATVRYECGRVAVVGTGCMGLGAEKARGIAAKATTVARIRAQLAKVRRELDEVVAAQAWASALPLPKPVFTQRRLRGSDGHRVVEVGDGWAELAIAGTDGVAVARASADYAENRAAERLGKPVIMSPRHLRSSLRSQAEDLEERLKRAEASLQKAAISKAVAK